MVPFFVGESLMEAKPQYRHIIYRWNRLECGFNLSAESVLYL